MDPKTKELVEAAERLIEMPVLATWVMPDPAFADFQAHKDTIAALCAGIREQAEKQHVERILWLQFVDIMRHWTNDPSAWTPVLRQITRKLIDHGIPPHMLAYYAIYFGSASSMHANDRG